eukprot:scaffold4925_cov125-Isochrysis_galbana.AAC.2
MSPSSRHSAAAGHSAVPPSRHPARLPAIPPAGLHGSPPPRYTLGLPSPRYTLDGSSRDSRVGDAPSLRRSVTDELQAVSLELQQVHGGEQHGVGRGGAGTCGSKSGGSKGGGELRGGGAEMGGGQAAWEREYSKGVEHRRGWAAQSAGEGRVRFDEIPLGRNAPPISRGRASWWGWLLGARTGGGSGRRTGVGSRGGGGSNGGYGSGDGSRGSGWLPAFVAGGESSLVRSGGGSGSSGAGAQRMAMTMVLKDATRALQAKGGAPPPPRDGLAPGRADPAAPAVASASTSPARAAVSLISRGATQPPWWERRSADAPHELHPPPPYRHRNSSGGSQGSTAAMV